MQRSPAHHRSSGSLVALGSRVAPSAGTRGLVGTCRLAIPAALAGLAALAVALIAPVAHAQPAPDYGLEWRTIGDPGNRPTIPAEVPSWPELEVGAVPYEYRLTQTEVTASQWFEFAVAYVRWNPSQMNNTELTGAYIQRGWDNTLNLAPGSENLPNLQSWRMAARFCNWLHNGKADAAWAFEAGAYDTSTFTENPDGSLNDQLSRSPGATFWIPSQDEWVKGAFYDPDRYGPGLGGYWRAPNGTNEPLISGLPENGGETSAGYGVPSDRYQLPVGSYPHVQSPWGLLDISGSEREMSETYEGTTASDRRLLGSQYRTGPYWVYDRPDNILITNTWPTSVQGLRLASVPSGGSSLFAVLVLFSIGRRVRR